VEEISKVISDELLSDKALDMREYVRKPEWNIYEDFPSIKQKFK
jgi:hypothetical protein